MIRRWLARHCLWYRLIYIEIEMRKIMRKHNTPA